MDDWNDFGNMPPHSSSLFDPDNPYPDSSHSTLDTYSDSSTLVDPTTPTNHTHSHTGSHSNSHPNSNNNPALSVSQPVSLSTTTSDRPSFLSSLPFLPSSRNRRPDRNPAPAPNSTSSSTSRHRHTDYRQRLATAESTHLDHDPVRHTARAAPSAPSPSAPSAPSAPFETPPSSSTIPADPDPVAPDPPLDCRPTSVSHPMEELFNSDRIIPVSAPNNEDMSEASTEDAPEPRSVMMPPTRAALNRSPLDEDPERSDGAPSYTPVFTPRRGDLDDVPDDYELNIEGFHFALNSHSTSSDPDAEPATGSVVPSSFLQRLDKSYIKLEVISAKQIRGLISFFHFFCVVSILYTFIVVFLNNFEFKAKGPHPLPDGILTDAQRKASTICFAVPRDGLTSEIVAIPNCSAIPTARVFSHTHLTHLATLRNEIQHCPGFGGPGEPPEASVDRLFAVSGLQMSRSGFIWRPVCPLDVFVPRSEMQEPSANQSAGGQQIPPISNIDRDTHAYYRMIEMTITVLSSPFRLIHSLIASLLSVFFLIIAFLFFMRIWDAKRKNITHEQLWVLVLILVTALYFNVFENMVDLIQIIRFYIDKKTLKDDFPDGVNKVSDFLSCLRDTSFMTFTFFYLWASCHSYRILDPLESLSFRKFYLPKIVVLLPLAMYHVIIYLTLDLRFTEVPFLSAPGLAYVFGDFDYWNYLYVEVILCIMKTIFDVLVFLFIAKEAYITAKTLEHAPYMKYRAKRVGFRFFLYLNSIFYFLFFTLYWILFFAKPKGDLVVRIANPIDKPRAGLIFLTTSGLWPLIMGYVLCTAFVHLPYTSIGWFCGWFRASTLASSGSRWSFPSMSIGSDMASHSKRKDPSSRNFSITDSPPLTKETNHSKSPNEAWSADDETPVSLVDNDAELQQQIVEPITYRKRESKDSLELKANCFTMQTHVIMFNFAWYVYYYGTPKLEKFRPRENPLPFEFAVDRHVKSAVTDTQALVLDCTDRIIVTFKGTTSMKNLRTSMRLSHEMLQSVIRLNADGEDESERLRKLFGARYMLGKIHKGFATAYLSVMDEVIGRVRTLRNRKARPVFLTGHSLGGALATICSLDLWVKLNISRREIFVSTFGSPRVGNVHFAMVYKEVVPLHWRIVVDPDMIAKLPRVGYAHVGKKVVLTPHGDMIIDPNALEHRPWTGERGGFAYHRKASYLLAMRAWCLRNHGMTYTPVFWPFPVRPEDERRFAGAFDTDDEDGSGDGRKVAAKIIHMDAMVDALGRVGSEAENMAVVEKWARLTRRVLLNDKLRNGANNS